MAALLQIRLEARGRAQARSALPDPLNTPPKTIGHWNEKREELGEFWYSENDLKYVIVDSSINLFGCLQLRRYFGRLRFCLVEMETKRCRLFT